ncbi:hypothetical protein SAMN05720469_12310 [Fibrobacter intestinalis]|uniref:Restriction endonuclease type I HsdR second RecA-like helicase domain-containing protein n=1 Tax=Fibrobacter intestinalis TaxID=28122 RepID=A0A1M6WBJ4_9BACT|nr:hypothetical protein SAMN05720469_12310 [Fibrobacter intestinalis]
MLRAERESWRVFGDYIHTYYYDKSIADGYTLKLMREPIETRYKETLQGILDELENNSANQIQVKKSDIDKDAIIEHPKYLNALLDYIIDDFTSFRIACDDKSVGAMIVCKTNEQARKLYALWNERYDLALSVIEKKKEEIALMAAEKLMHYNASFFEKPLKASLILHDEGDKKERKEYIVDYKKNMATDFLIVNKMLLTGFDANRLKKLYLGRKLDGHDLLQALTRVNRPYKDFKYGYVVDFVDIKENFDATNDRYLRELNKTTEDSGLNLPTDPGQVIIENPEEVKRQIKDLTDFLWNFPTENYEEFRKVIDDVDDKEPLYHLRKILENAKGLGNRIRSSGNVELQDKYKNMLPGGIPVLLREVDRRIATIHFNQQRYVKSDKAQVDAEIKTYGMTMMSGQILYHGGVLNVDVSTDPIILTEPLSTTINPQIAVGEALHKGKAYHSGAFHLNVIKIINPDVKVYPFKANRRMSYEAEVLLEAGIRLKKVSGSIVDSNYKVHGLFQGTTRIVEKIVEAHIIEWEII